MWKYNLKSNCVEEQPTIEMPNNNYDFPPDGPSDSMLRSAIDHFDEEWGKYNNHCNSLRSIPVSGKVTWEDGEDVTDKFTVEEENFEKVVVPIVDFSKVVYLADACPEKNQPIEYETDRELEESLFNGVPEDIKNKIISESDWRATNGHGGVDEVTKENFIQATIFGYLLSKPKEHKSDENSLPKSDIEQEAEKRYSAKMFIGETGTKFDNLTLDQVDYLISADNAIRDNASKEIPKDISFNLKTHGGSFKNEDVLESIDYKAKYEKCINIIKRFDAGIIGFYGL